MLFRSSSINEVKNIATIPISGFYGVRSINSNLTANILSPFNYNNNTQNHNLNKEAIDFSKKNNYCFISKDELIIISYIDINGKENSIHYKGKQPITEEYYNETINATLDNENRIFTIDNLNLENLLKIMYK